MGTAMVRRGLFLLMVMEKPLEGFKERLSITRFPLQMLPWELIKARKRRMCGEHPGGCCGDPGKRWDLNQDNRSQAAKRRFDSRQRGQTLEV